MTLSVDPEPKVEPEFTGPTAEDRGSATAGETKRAPSRTVLVLVAILALLIGGLGGGLIGDKVGSDQAEQEYAQAVADQRDKVAELQSDVAAFGEDISALEDDRAALADSLASTEDLVDACQLAAVLAQEVIDNRQATFDLIDDPSLPLDPLDPEWDRIGAATYKLDVEFTRLVGRFEVAATVCVSSVEGGTTEG